MITNTAIVSCDLTDSFFTNCIIGQTFQASVLNGVFFENTSMELGTFLGWNNDLFKQTENYRLKELKYFYSFLIANSKTTFRPLSTEEKFDLSNFNLESVGQIVLETTNLENAIISNCVFCRGDLKAIESTQSYKNKALLGNFFADSIKPSDVDFTNFNLTGCKFRADCLTNAKFDGAIITNCYFFGDGLTIEQVKSTWNWKNRQMDTVVFSSKEFQKVVDEERKKEGF